MTSPSILASLRNRRIIGFTMSVLLHVLVLVFAIKHEPMPLKESGFEPNAPLTVQLLPPSTQSQRASTPPTATAAAKPAPRPRPQPKGQPRETARTNQLASRQSAPKPSKTPTPETPVAPQARTAPNTTAPSAAPAGDMMDMLQAARDRRRAAGIPDANDAPQENSTPSDDNAVARANVQFSVSRGRNEGGGVFEVPPGSKGVRSATLVFHGWNVLRRNVTRQSFEIDAGLNGDIDTAIIRKMIEIIRQEKKGDFTWESIRLGKPVVLSARLKDDAELEAFLRQDFFDYVSRR